MNPAATFSASRSASSRSLSSASASVITAILRMIALGMLLSLTGQWGDLVMSSIKRDLGIKDMAATIPGHGGLLDRFDSLIFVAPAGFHYLGYLLGLRLHQPTRIMTGS